MRLVSFVRPGGLPVVGVQLADGVVDLAQTDPTLPSSLKGLLTAGPSMVTKAREAAQRKDAIVVRQPKLVAPIPDPGKVICVGLNYREHAKETNAAIPTEPVIFNKFPNAIIGIDDAIVLPKETDQVDFEAELVVVIGKKARRLSESQALDAVAGYTIGNDVSARDWQKNKPGKQWLLGKSFDTFAPLGPALVTADAIADPHNLNISFRLNGETMQQSNTGDMIFRIPHLLAYISQVTTLEPGDVLFTGTPAGVGFARQPQVFLKPGDRCEVEIEHLGLLRNTCSAGSFGGDVSHTN